MATAADSSPSPAPQASPLASAKADLSAVLQATPNLQQGMTLFQICADCHGPHGAGNASGWPPEIAGQHPRVVAKELTDFRAGLRWYDPMERIAGRHVLHTTQDIADVAAYVGSLARSRDTDSGPGKWLEPGGRMYASRCQWCHGDQGEGSDERFVPRVAGQQYEYLLRQLQDTVGGRRPSMRTDHLRLLEGAHMQDLEGLAGYMSRLDRPTGQAVQNGAQKHMDGTLRSGGPDARHGAVHDPAASANSNRSRIGVHTGYSISLIRTSDQHRNDGLCSSTC
jgi:cytochrome c553